MINTSVAAHSVRVGVIGVDNTFGVIDPYGPFWNYPTLRIVDRSMVTANLGFNPSLTITPQAEGPFSLWPNNDEDDPRPTQDKNYRRIMVVRPNHSVVPKDAWARFVI